MNLWRVWLRSADGRRAQAGWRREYRVHRRANACQALCLEGVALEIADLAPRLIIARGGFLPYWMGYDPVVTMGIDRSDVNNRLNEIIEVETEYLERQIQNRPENKFFGRQPAVPKRKNRSC